MTEKRCPKCKLTLSLDKFHNDRTSPDGKSCYCGPCNNSITKTQTHARVVRNRARQRAIAQLVKLHWDEFKALQAICAEEAIQEMRQLEEATKDNPTPDGLPVRLRPGQRNEGESAVDRINEEWCPECTEYHGNGHHVVVKPRRRKKAVAPTPEVKSLPENLNLEPEIVSPVEVREPELVTVVEADPEPVAEFVVEADPDYEPELRPPGVELRVSELAEDGMPRIDIARELGITVYEVRKILEVVG